MYEIAYVPAAGAVELRPARDPGDPGPGQVRVRVTRAGFCGTDREIVRGAVAVLPDGTDALVLGHEMCGVVEACGPDVDGLRTGDPVACTVRIGCDACSPCRAGRADFCLTGGYFEHGITRLDGFARPAIVVPASSLARAPDGLGPLAVLAEPLSIAEKALEQAEAVRGRIPGIDPSSGRVLVAGAGPVGILATWLCHARGYEVEAIDLRDDDSLTAELVRLCGATYTRAEKLEPADVVLECAGDPQLAFELLDALRPGGVLVWVGVMGGDERVTVDGARLLLDAVLRHHAAVATINAARVHFERALSDLAVFARTPGFDRIVTEVVPPEGFERAIWPRDGAIKQVVDLGEQEHGGGAANTSDTRGKGAGHHA